MGVRVMRPDGFERAQRQNEIAQGAVFDNKDASGVRHGHTLAIGRASFLAWAARRDKRQSP